MEAIANDYKPGKKIVFTKVLPGKWDSKFAEMCEKDYLEYIKQLDALEVDYINERNLDRALWVYGHTFMKENLKNGFSNPKNYPSTDYRNIIFFTRI